MDALDQFNEESFEGKLKLEHVPSKHLKITMPAGDGEEHDTVVKVKFYQHGDKQLLAQFTRKSGNIMEWYKNFDSMKELGLNFLASPCVPIAVEDK